MTKRISILVLLSCVISCAGLGQTHNTFKSVLGTDAIRTVVRSEIEQVRDLAVHDDFVEWSVRSIEEMRAPEAAESARQLLTLGYHEFVLGVTAYSKGRGSSALNMELGEEFRRVNTVCGPIPCNEEKCCQACQKPCK